MRAAVEDVHHRHRQQVGVGTADVAVERQPRRLGRGLGDGQRGAEDRVGAEVGLVGRAVELVHDLVDLALVVGTHALDRRADLLDHARRRPSARPCRGSGRRRRAARPPRTGPWRHRWARPRGRTRRRRAAPRPRRWGCRASRGSRGRRLLRWMPRVAPWPLDEACAVSCTALTLFVATRRGNRGAPVDRGVRSRTMATDGGHGRDRHAVRHDVRRTLGVYDQTGVPFFSVMARGTRRPVAGAAGREGPRHRLGSRRGRPARSPRRRARRAASTRRRRARDGRQLAEDTAHLAARARHPGQRRRPATARAAVRRGRLLDGDLLPATTRRRR